MQPDRQVVRGHRREERPKAWLVERMPGDVGDDLHAARAHLDGAIRFADREIDVIHVDRGGEGRETVGMLGAELRHGLVGHPRQLVATSPSAISSIGGFGSEMICR